MLMPAAQGVTLGVAATTLTLGCLGYSRGGFSVNHMDIAPKYAGVVMGISNTAGGCGRKSMCGACVMSNRGMGQEGFPCPCQQGAMCLSHAADPLAYEAS